MCFVDFEKVFDNVKHEPLIETLKRYGVDGADIRIIAKLYLEQKALVRVEDEWSGWVNIEKGVRQGCVLSPDLFSLYSPAHRFNPVKHIAAPKTDGCYLFF